MPLARLSHTPRRPWPGSKQFPVTSICSAHHVHSPDVEIAQSRRLILGDIARSKYDTTSEIHVEVDFIVLYV